VLRGVRLRVCDVFVGLLLEDSRAGDPECGSVQARLRAQLRLALVTLIVCALAYLDYRVTISFAFCRLS
jgi:hypothetical protein